MIDIKNKAKNTRTIAICSLIFGLFSVIPFYIGTLFNIISWILYMIVLYRLKIYAGAKNLFKNYFIVLFTLFFYFILFYFMILFFYYVFLNEEYFLLMFFTPFLLAIHILFCLLYFKFLKIIFYEIARVTNQPYFVKVCKMYFYGFLTLPILIGMIFIIIGWVYNFLAWWNFKEFNESEFIENEQKIQ
ncbi:DUF996 domain-containing protein [Campylobacter armoricus]|uniref:DUF996 domain-containing protein n=1 Tax=Campylobacter armoricus TaxID=2505970 RepID=UPI0011164BA3|nr:DUF996 domain-containing protein [Campylobacter armoricus]